MMLSALMFEVAKLVDFKSGNPIDLSHTSCVMMVSVLMCEANRLLCLLTVRPTIGVTLCRVAQPNHKITIGVTVSCLVTQHHHKISSQQISTHNSTLSVAHSFFY